MSPETQLYRGLSFLFHAYVVHEQWPRHAADHSWHAALTGRCGVCFVELQGAGGQVHLRPRAGHRVDVEVVLLTCQVQPAGSRDDSCGQ